MSREDGIIDFDDIVPSEQELLRMQEAIAKCDQDGKCICGDKSGHMGWLVCVLKEYGPPYGK